MYYYGYCGYCIVLIYVYDTDMNICMICNVQSTPYFVTKIHGMLYIIQHIIHVWISIHILVVVYMFILCDDN